MTFALAAQAPAERRRRDGAPYGEPALQQGTDHLKLIVASMVNRRAEPMFAELACSLLMTNPPREPAGCNRDVAVRAGWACVKDR